MSHTTIPNSLSTRARRRELFARDAVYSEFGGRHARALDYQDFRDRRPHEAPVRLDHVADVVVADLAHSAVRHWLAEADRAKDAADRRAALEIAGNIARMAGLDRRAA